MIVVPLPTPLDAVVSVPGSKSIANRALVCAALADGESTITGLPDGDDTEAMLDCLAALGVEVVASGSAATITGTGSIDAGPGAVAHAKLAGTTSRFIAALAALSPEPVILDGFDPLRQRPFGPLFTALRALGADVRTPGDTALPALISGPPTGSSVALPGDVSSQFVSALMLIAPALPGGLRIKLSTGSVSRPYLDLTADVMAAFGVEDVAMGDREIVVGPSGYAAAGLDVEADASTASYPLALAPMVGGRVTVGGLGNRSRQGDAAFADLLQRMGCRVERTADATTVACDPGQRLGGIDINMADISDLVPTMAVVAAVADTPTTIRGVGFIRGKESDRLGDLSRELQSAGVDIDETDDGLVIRPSADALRAAELDTHHDHRLAMAFGVLGCRVDGIDVADPDVVSKSFPGFWDLLERLRHR